MMTPVKVLIAPDKFKGTLTAEEAADAISSGWQAVRPGDALELLPMSDGGDGFGEVMSRLLRAEPQSVETVDAAHRPCNAQWWWAENTQTAIIESANVIGLAMLPARKYHPFELDTFGLGAVLQAVAARGARRCIIGIGGSATNDGGFGMARALGWRFQSSHGHVLSRWHELHDLALLHDPRHPLDFDELLVAVDVRNPLLGPKGCTRVYGPQKGLKPDDFEFAERCLGRLARTAERYLRVGFALAPGAGAAGGLGFGLMAFAGARPQSGFALFAEEARLDQRIEEADLVITGEGALDDQSLMGKGVGELGARCRQADTPCIALAGACAVNETDRSPFQQIQALTPDFVTTSEALARPSASLRALAEKVAMAWPR